MGSRAVDLTCIANIHASRSEFIAQQMIMDSVFVGDGDGSGLLSSLDDAGRAERARGYPDTVELLVDALLEEVLSTEAAALRTDIHLSAVRAAGGGDGLEVAGR